MTDPNLLYAAYLGIVIGVLARTYLPFLFKQFEDGTPIKFQRKYIVSAIVALGGALTTAQPLFAAFSLPGDATGYLGAFLAGLLYAGIVQTVLNTVFLDYQKTPASPAPPAK